VDPKGGLLFAPPSFRIPAFGAARLVGGISSRASLRPLDLESLDFLADDWTHISAKEITRRALLASGSRPAAAGILLLHDIQPPPRSPCRTWLAGAKRGAGTRLFTLVCPRLLTRPRAGGGTDVWNFQTESHPARSWAAGFLAVGNHHRGSTASLRGGRGPANFGRVRFRTGEGRAVDQAPGARGKENRRPARRSPPAARKNTAVATMSKIQDRTVPPRSKTLPTRPATGAGLHL